ncbi:MAG TPA: TMEM175 family protein [Solirubrobacterales bacterium]
MSRAATAQRREDNEIEFSRIVAFSDGVFAIAITLLVLNLGVPDHIREGELGQAIWDQRQTFIAYALSFAVIGRFWVVHHRFFADVIGFDSRLIALNLFYLGWIVLIPFSSEVLGAHGGETASIVLYAVNLAGVTLVGALMFTDARRSGLAETDPAVDRQNRQRALVTIAVFLASIPVAFIDPEIVAYLWLALFINPIGRLNRRRA